MRDSILRTALLVAGIIGATGVTGQQQITLRGAELYDQGIFPAHISVDMSKIPEPRAWRPGDPIKEIPQRKGVPRDYVAPFTDLQPPGPNALRELNQRMPSLSGGPAFDVPLIERDGVGFTGVNPPDTIGDVGNEYFIQMINGGEVVDGTRVLILDKTDGSEVGSFALRELAVGSGTGCTTGRGDPILMFDETVENGPGELPGRWVLSEMTSVSLCVYVSQNADPTAGNWFLYEFASSSGGLPDYHKWAVWPDAYYVGANENGSSPGPGRAVYAFDRENMLQGQMTRPTQLFEAPLISGFGFQMLQPADWDGRIAPPNDSPGLFFRHRDDEVHNGGSSDPTQDFLEIWEFSVDWDAPGNSMFSGPTNIGVADFESELCGLTAFECVPQPGTTTRLDPLREPVMWRVQYRNFGSYGAIVGSWVSDVVGGAADIHGVQWAELRDPGTGWTLFQEGVVSPPDDVNRWMSSIAMDGTGNIAMGYNVSDDSIVFPGLRYIGRLASDALNTMPRGEITLVDGSAANGSNRYGDYSALAVDPIDECTFWFTGEYNTSAQWSTRIGSFRFVDCGEPGFLLRSPNADGGVCTLADPQVFVSDIEVFSIEGLASPVTLVFDPALPSGITGGFSPNPVSPGANSTSTLTVDQTAPAGIYDLTVRGSAAGADDQTMRLRVAVSDQIPATTSPASPADGASNVASQPLLQWQSAFSAESYLVEVATDPAFNTIVFDEIVSDTEAQVDVQLDFSTSYYWRVTATNQCGDGSSSSVFEFTTQPEPGDCPIGAPVLTVFEDDMENGANGWTLGDGSIFNTWQQTTDNAVSGTTSWNAENLDEISDQRLVSPPIQLPGASELPLTLRFWNRQEIEAAFGGDCWDAGLVEISTDGGGSWTQLQSEVLFREFDGTVNNFAGGPNPLAGSPAWCGDPRDWEDYVVDLSSYAGEEIQLRYRLGTDGTEGGRDGWSLDDVRIESCGAEELFSDGFESPPPL